jgi:competence protein ComEC
LSVGHGEAILVEAPSGGTLLYDAGAIEDGRVAQRAVQSTLWDRRRTRIDAIVASHADIDHFNGITGLMQCVPVGELLVSQQFLDFRQPAVVALCDATAACHVPIRLVRDGDHLQLDSQVAIKVLHPPPGLPQADDNANSIVLLIEYAGRRILLTGDLEGSGQTTLLSHAPCATDILLAPHHGSRRSNSARLAEWAQPQQVIVSGGPKTDFRSLRAAYGPEAEILSTDDFGAITFDICADGSISRTAVRQRSDDRRERTEVAERQ